MSAETKNAHGLTPREEKFAVGKAAGMTNVEARAIAGYSDAANPKTAKEHACRVNARAHVQARIRELQAAVEAKEILEIEQIQARLTQIAMDEKNSRNIQLKALDQLAKTKGAYSDNINVHSSGTLSIRDKEEAFKELLGE